MIHDAHVFTHPTSYPTVARQYGGHIIKALFVSHIQPKFLTIGTPFGHFHIKAFLKNLADCVP